MFSQRSAFAPGTFKNLQLQWRTFLIFCLYFKLESIPASLNTICLYVQFLSRSFRSVVSIRNYLHGVKVLHVLSGRDFVHFDHIEYKLLIKGLFRLKSHRVKQAAPITPHILAAMFQFFDFSLPLHVACWASFLLTFFIMARKSNMVPSSYGKFDFNKQLARRDIILGPSGLLVVLRWSKVNQVGKRQVVIPVPSFGGSLLCPVLAYSRLVALVAARDLDPAFTYCVRPRLQCVTSFRFVKILRHMLSRAGFPALEFTGHSFRRGGATFAFQANVPGELIKLQGDWSSEAYLRYLDFSLSSKLGVGLAMQQLIRQYGI